MEIKEDENNLLFNEKQSSLKLSSDINEYKWKIILIVTSFIIFITAVIFVLVLIFKADSSEKEDEIIVKDNTIILYYEINNIERIKNLIHSSFIEHISSMELANIDKGSIESIDPITSNYTFKEVEYF